MFLLEGYVYWPDMAGLAILFFIAVGVWAIVSLLRKGSLPAPNDDEKLRQEIMDGLNKAISDIKKTV